MWNMWLAHGLAPDPQYTYNVLRTRATNFFKGITPCCVRTGHARRDEVTISLPTEYMQVEAELREWTLDVGPAASVTWMDWWVSMAVGVAMSHVVGGPGRALAVQWRPSGRRCQPRAQLDSQIRIEPPEWTKRNIQLCADGTGCVQEQDVLPRRSIMHQKTLASLFLASALLERVDLFFFFLPRDSFVAWRAWAFESDVTRNLNGASIVDDYLAPVQLHGTLRPNSSDSRPSIADCCRHLP